MSVIDSVRWLALAATSVAVFTACSDTSDSGVDNATGIAAVSPSEPPKGRLGDSVAPTQYSIELSIDPSEERFSGVVVIDITLARAQESIWLHGKDLSVSEVYLTDSQGDRVDASYEERLDSGVALVSSRSSVQHRTLH